MQIHREFLRLLLSNYLLINQMKKLLLIIDNFKNKNISYLFSYNWIIKLDKVQIYN